MPSEQTRKRNQISYTNISNKKRKLNKSQIMIVEYNLECYSYEKKRTKWT